jgi:hypothetical protein
MRRPIQRARTPGQLLLLQELNRRQLSLEQAKQQFYDVAVAQNPASYRTYSFKQWVKYLQNQFLIAQQGNMMGLSVRARDFLKFLVHTRRSREDRAF